MESESPDKATCEMCGKATADVFPYVNNDEEKPEEPSESSHPKQLCQTCVTQMNMCDDLMNFLDKAADDYTPPTTSSAETEEVEITGQTIIKSMPDKDDDKDVSAESDEVLKSILNLYSGDDVVPTASQSFSSPSVVECVEQRTVEYSADTSAKYPGILTKDASKIVDNRRLSVTVEKMQSKSDATDKHGSKRLSTSSEIDSRKSSTDDNKKSKISEIAESQRTGLVKTAVTPMEVDLTEPALSNEEPGTVPSDQNMESTVPETATVENNSVKGINIDNLLLSIDPEELFSIHGVDVTLPIKCDFCPEVFYDFDEFDDHMISHKEAHFFSCQLCSNTYISWQNLVAHRKALHHAEVISCDPCSKRRNHPDLGPVNYPVKGYPIGCEECNEGFSTPNQLYRHYKIKMNHSSKGIKVSFLPSGESSKDNIGKSSEEIVGGQAEDDEAREREIQRQKFIRQAPVKFVCPVCNTNFCSSQELAIHMSKLAEDIVAETCDVCNAKFCNRFVLEAHRKIHPEPKPQPKASYLCSICGKTFKDRIGFDRHNLWHAGIKRFKCTYCSQRFSKRSTLESHKFTHPLREVYRCRNCTLAFDDIEELEKHISETHKEAEEKLICDVCEKQFDINNFLEHYKECHFIKESELIQLRRLKVTCPICSKVLSSTNALRRHVKLHGPNAKKPHVCEVCNKTILYHTEIVFHARTHYGPDDSNLPEKYRELAEKMKNRPKKGRPAKPGNKTFVCEFCAKVFFRKKNFVIHVRRHKNERPYVCQTCGKSFYTKPDLVIHNRFHTGERPYVCSLCSKVFISATSLYMHRKTHNRDIPKYTCSYCGKQTAWKSTHISHVRSHTGERPFVCTICNKSFPVSARLNAHLKRHAIRLAGFQCTSCGSCFNSATELSRHMNKECHFSVALPGENISQVTVEITA